MSLTRRPGLTYLGGARYGAWLSRSTRPEDRRSGLCRGPGFVEANVLGRSVGLCW